MTIQQSGGRAARERAREPASQGDRVDPLARGLGLFSIGLGLAELMSPRAFARTIGLPDDDDHRSVVRGAGLRELATGVGILTHERPSALLWSRVAGDVMDLLLLARGGQTRGADGERLAVAAGAVLGVTVIDVIAATRSARDLDLDVSGLGRQGRVLAERARRTARRLAPSTTGRIEVNTSITINRPREQVYAFWRKLENLPSFMSHLESVRVLGEGKSHWCAKAPLGRTVEWDAEITEDRPHECLAWRSLEGADIRNEGRVRFVDAPGQRGTELHVALGYDAPGSVVGATLAKLFGEEPSEQVRSDLRRFKQVMETGEVLHSDASVHPSAHAAQPGAAAPTAQGMLLQTEVRS